MLDPKNLNPGEEQHEYFTSRGRPRKRRCQYDYRAPDGELFSCVRNTLIECRIARTEWETGRGEKK